MAKINQKEYELLKSLDDKWKWIARDGFTGIVKVYEDRPQKIGLVKEWTPTGDKANRTIFKRGLFQFIQWEDEEPYNIAELIEGYEIHQKASELFSVAIKNVNKSMIDAVKEIEKESKKKEVKDLEWVRREFNKLYLSGTEIYMNPDEKTRIEVSLLNKIQSIFDEMDEPEITFEQVYDFLREDSVLSDKSFDYYWNCIADGVEMDEPKPADTQKILDEQVITSIGNRIIQDLNNPRRIKLADIMKRLSSLEENAREQWLSKIREKYGKESDYNEWQRGYAQGRVDGVADLHSDKNISISSAPVIPQYVAEDVKEIRKTEGSNLNKLSRELNVHYHGSIIGGNSYKYLNDKCTFNEVLEILKGNYEIEEEPLYYVKDRYMDALLIKVSGEVEQCDNNRDYSEEEHTFKLTEQEIKDYDVNYWVFAKPVEE